MLFIDKLNAYASTRASQLHFTALPFTEAQWLNWCYLILSPKTWPSYIVTLIKADELERLLDEYGCDRTKTKYLVDGFKEGFSLRYQGNLKKGKRLAPNLKLRVGSPTELWNKVMNEVELGRYTGPFEDLPFEDFVQSPIGLVPKDKGLKTRLIFHLSYPKDGDSVNSGIPKEDCTVKYPDFEEAIKLCVKEGACCSLAKSDMSSTFRHVSMKKDQLYPLVMKATHPES